MTTPRNARSVGNKRLYRWRGEDFWSVTTIIGGGLNKPALINWAKKFTAEYAVNNFDALTALVKADPDGAIDWLKGAAWRDRDKGGKLGSEVHDAIDAYTLGRPFPKWRVDVAPRMRAFEKFIADYEPVFESSEEEVYSRKEKYAGRYDAIVVIDGRRLLIDTKTSKSGIFPEIGLQLAAYRYAEFLGLPDGSEAPMPKVDGCAALWLAPSGEYEFLDVRADEEVFRAFLYIREAFRFAEVTSKSIVLGAIPRAKNEAEVAFAKEMGEVA